MRTQHLVIRGLHTDKCLGIKLFGTVPEGGFTAFAEICRKHKLRWNPRVKMWFLLKQNFESQGKAISHINACLNEVHQYFIERVNRVEIDFSKWLTSPPASATTPRDLIDGNTCVDPTHLNTEGVGGDCI